MPLPNKPQQTGEHFPTDHSDLASQAKLPLISIITITFNNATGLEATIKSVLAQAYPALEHIVIDGGSTDGTLAVIKKYQKHFAYWISEPDQGIYDAINKGIAQAHGALLNILNSGDCYTPSILETVAQQYQDHPFKIALCDYIWVSPGQQWHISANPDILKTGDAVCHQALFYQSQLHQDFGKYDLNYPLAADYHFVRRVYEEYEFLSIKKSACYYQLGGISDRAFMDYADQVRQICHQLDDPFWKVEWRYWLKYLKFFARRLLQQWHLTSLLFFYRRYKYSNRSTPSD